MSEYGRAVTLLGLMRELGEVMRAEVAVVGQMKLDRLAALQAEKSALAERYERELRAFRSEPEAAAALAPEIRDGLRDAMMELQASATTSTRRLAAARGVVEGIVRVLGEAAADGATAGRYPSRAPTRDARVVPLTLSRQV